MAFLTRTLVLGLAVVFSAACADRALRPEPDLESPRVNLSNIRVAAVGLFEQRYVLDLRVQNPNPVSLPITGLEYRLAVNGDEFGHGVSNKSVTVEPYGEAMLSVDIISGTGEALQQVRRLAEGRRAAFGYRLEGGLRLRGAEPELPFAYEGRVGPVEQPNDNDQSLL